MVWGVYKLKERRRVDILDDEIRGTLGNFSDKAAPTPRRLIESKALAQVAVRIICLVSPLSLNAGASTPCQDSLNRHPPAPEHRHKQSHTNKVRTGAPSGSRGRWFWGYYEINVAYLMSHKE